MVKLGVENLEAIHLLSAQIFGRFERSAQIGRQRPENWAPEDLINTKEMLVMDLSLEAASYFKQTTMECRFNHVYMQTGGPDREKLLHHAPWYFFILCSSERHLD